MTYSVRSSLILEKTIKKKMQKGRLLSHKKTTTKTRDLSLRRNQIQRSKPTAIQHNNITLNTLASKKIYRDTMESDAATTATSITKLRNNNDSNSPEL